MLFLTDEIHRRRESGLEMKHRKILILESIGTGCYLKERHNNGKKCVFVSIGVLSLLYFVFFYKENFDYLVGGDEKERDNENM